MCEGTCRLGGTPGFARAAEALAAVQGRYDGSLAAVAAWGPVAADPAGFRARVLFQVCVAAGLHGAATVSRRILLIGAGRLR
ncbi:DUF1304 family protein [Streptomyces sp. SP18CS02]|uniref:DUF1304 family protein n=1 Tax=Streptomyces sp. SP18CS02 TaxID=3002531 RepID=UPI003FCCB513